MGHFAANYWPLREIYWSKNAITFLSTPHAPEWLLKRPEKILENKHRRCVLFLLRFSRKKHGFLAVDIVRYTAVR